MSPLRGRAALLVAAVACVIARREGPAPAPACAAPHAAGARGALAAVGCVRGGDVEPVSGAAGLLFGIPIDLNRATARDLEALPGIGPGRARAIVRARAEAPFCRVEELLRVDGLGPVTVARLAPLIAADAPGCAGS